MRPRYWTLELGSTSGAALRVGATLGEVREGVKARSKSLLYMPLLERILQTAVVISVLRALLNLHNNGKNC